MVSRAAWVGGGLGARLLMIAVLAMAVQLTVTNNTRRTYVDDFYKLQSYSYAVAAAAIGMAGAVLQVPVAVYLLCKSKRTTPSALVLDVSMHVDVVVTIVLATGVGAGFGATVDALRYVRHSTWPDDETKQDFIRYYNKAFYPVVFLLAGMVLSMAATVVSARLRPGRPTATSSTCDHIVTGLIIYPLLARSTHRSQFVFSRCSHCFFFSNGSDDFR